MSEKNLHGYVVRFNRDTNEWEACNLYISNVYLWDQRRFIKCENEILDFAMRAEDYDKFQKKLADQILERIRYDINHEIDDAAREIAGKISYTKKCVCEHPPTHLANDCHEHTENPAHYFGSLESSCDTASCYGEKETDSPYIRSKK